MIGWWVAPKYRRWQERSSQEQVEASTRWMLIGSAWMTSAIFLVQLVPEAAPGRLPSAMAWCVLGLGVVQCLSCSGLLRQVLDSYLGTGSVTGVQLALPAAAAGAMTVLTVSLVAMGAIDNGLIVGLALAGSLAPFATTFGLAVRRRTAVLAMCGYAAAAPATLAVSGLPGRAVLYAEVIAGLGCFFWVFTGRSSAWYLAVIRELQEARGVQARLAVAEERLRFSRDLHDVMGRNLSAIALKSELAAQLVQRGGAAEPAVEQMTQVQSIARESQSEVRAVVRGYREVDLPTELAGARGILRAAGVDCRTDNGGSQLPASVQAALGWVVREGATNVLRHADAAWCTVWVGTDPAGVNALLVMENDGVHASSGGGAGGRAGTGQGSGLAGLRERLDRVGGRLHTELDAGSSKFRLSAEVPLSTGTAGASASVVPAAADVHGGRAGTNGDRDGTVHGAVHSTVAAGTSDSGKDTAE